MRIIRLCCLIIGALVICACTPVKTNDINQYRISAFSANHRAKTATRLTLQVTQPEEVAGYQTSQMLYMKKPFLIETFAKNSWTSPPGDMLYPLLVESILSSHYFHAVKTSIYPGDADYRLDTLVLELHQNFLKKPSVIDFLAKVTLTNISKNTPVVSKIISLHIPCLSDTPYGGVIAANRASYQFTALVRSFVLSNSVPT